MLECGEANLQAQIRVLSLSAPDGGERPIAQLVNITPGGKTTGFYFFFLMRVLIISV
jgi:hypothetical protein